MEHRESFAVANSYEFSPKLIYIKGSKYIVAYALSRIDKKENIYNENNNKVEPTLESLSENFGLNTEDLLLLTSFKTIMRFQQKDNSLTASVKKKS